LIFDFFFVEEGSWEISAKKMVRSLKSISGHLYF
jgi:hypothetical protein